MEQKNRFLSLGIALGPVSYTHLALTVEGGKITKAEVLEHSETEGVSDPAFEQIPAAIVEKQGTEGIETVAGCTRSSEGLLAAAEAFLLYTSGVEMCMPGDNVEMDVELISPIAIETGLRFAIREGGRTVGSGVVIAINE